MTKLEEFAKIKKQISLLEKEAESIKDEVLAETLKVGEPVETEFGKLTVRFFKTYTYSEKLQTFEKKVKEELKSRQEKEVADGVASLEEQPRLFFTASK